LKLNTQNITFGLNQHYTFVWLRHAESEDFHTRLLPFYLDEESFDKEVMSWPGVKHNPHKSGMHYLLPPKIRKKKGQEEGVGPSSSRATKKPKVQMPMDSEEEEDEEPLE
jgi:hypothetical protein